ncbi:PepSY domain-containing protein [Vreelandella piezotolerans]|uniref:PepSY domain-containing protein n=1 Tax=Vreelandella piezotolerans TaxID=2609667 RepID=A0ABQ6XAD9_9GAMM|nr:PepSY domain-containing protein [Halomonas piezotolerans]KAE8438445.1 PepSY domain-containing protein [Halomonas piezotolerans]QJA22870.1 PepSY domain-containing protein [Halomonas piezotolerans]
MNAMKKMLLIPASALLLTSAASSVQADSKPLGLIDDIFTYTSDYGFTHYKEVSIKSRGRAEVEGWLDGEWFADVEFSLENGDTLKEDRKRLITGPWGMSEEDIRQAFNVANQEGMIEFEEIEISTSGIIDIEGRDQNGRDMELKMQQGSLQITEIDMD